MNSHFQIECQPQLLEEAVLRAMANHVQAPWFWRARNQLYEENEGEAREAAFRDFYESWCNHLGLLVPLQHVLDQWPTLTRETSRCLLRQGRAKKQLGAELYVAAEEPGSCTGECRTIVIQLTPELLSHSRHLVEFLRHEFLHIVDMLDPHFGYLPDFPKSDAGPAYDHFLQSRYGVLWDVTIDGRLHQRGWLPAATREKHFQDFKRAFKGADGKLAEAFAYFFEQKSPTHHELVEFARHPEKWLGGESLKLSSQGRCAICHFPTFQLISSSALSREGIAKVQHDFPVWTPEQLICRQCADLYESRACMA